MNTESLESTINQISDQAESKRLVKGSRYKTSYGDTVVIATTPEFSISAEGFLALTHRDLIGFMRTLWKSDTGWRKDIEILGVPSNTDNGDISFQKPEGRIDKLVKPIIKYLDNNKALHESTVIIDRKGFRLSESVKSNKIISE